MDGWIHGLMGGDRKMNGEAIDSMLIQIDRVLNSRIHTNVRVNRVLTLEWENN